MRKRNADEQRAGVIACLAKVSKAIKQTCYHLYSPEETVSRAKSRLGERGYNLLWNNCEHYAVWCKTGLHESHQVQALLKKLVEQTNFNFTEAQSILRFHPEVHQLLL